MHQRTKLNRFILTLPALVFSLQACTVPITLKTQPQGATVIADGRIIGTTPMEIDPDALFPAKFKGYQWEREGTLRFEREGCKPYRLPVTNESVKRSVRIDLECEPGAAALAPKPAATDPAPKPVATDPVPVSKANPSAPKPVPMLKESALEQLEELNLMKQRGLISEEEFQTLRQRVMDRY